MEPYNLYNIKLGILDTNEGSEDDQSRHGTVSTLEWNRLSVPYELFLMTFDLKYGNYNQTDLNLVIVSFKPAFSLFMRHHNLNFDAHLNINTENIENIH